VTAGERPIRRLYVANRGEIARRIAVTATRLGIEAVVPDLERPGAVDLLDPAAVVAAALAAGTDAVHPGYGFLAESPELARAVAGAGLTWVGPPAEAIRTLGDKGAARGIARRLGIPVAEGAEPADRSDEGYAEAAAGIGYPVLVKPVAGGGGKGIRVVAAAAGLPAALAAARREAARAFADDRLLLERYLPDARHVEVQVLGDRAGGVTHLGDRDCSLQRRHQKVVEEAPAPGLSRALRRDLWDAAMRLAAAVGYAGAGTCEFLVAADGTWVFLEMNARLQVEHPVTELVLDRDLVADQLALARGATLAELGLEPAAIEARLALGGCAIEARINAEDPGAGFLPSAGRVVTLRWPADHGAFGPPGRDGVRIDAGIDAGDVVRGRYDPLLAKVIAVGPDREAARARLAAALDATELLGLPTNLGFLRRLLRLPVVVEGRATTRTLETDPAARSATDPPRIPDIAWTTAALLVAGRGRDDAWGGGWRLNGAPRLRLVADVPDGAAGRTVAIDRREAVVEPAGGAAAPVPGEDAAYLSVEGWSVGFRLAPPPDAEGAANAATAARGDTAATAAQPVAPMPGSVVGVHVHPGARVEAGGLLVTLEAMKMEHAVTAPAAGVVEAVLVRVGEQVVRGQPVVRLGAGA
jgi:acetyl/propionyl-CoA carboxylase alpha subunit